MKMKFVTVSLISLLLVYVSCAPRQLVHNQALEPLRKNDASLTPQNNLIFISFLTREAGTLAGLLAQKLRKMGKDVFYSEDSLCSGCVYPDVLNQELLKRDVFVPLVTPSYGTHDDNTSLWCLAELTLAFNKKKNIKPINFLERPLRYPPPHIALQLETFQATSWLPFKDCKDSLATNSSLKWPDKCLDHVAKVIAGDHIEKPQTPAVNYQRVAKEIFANFPIGPVHVPDLTLESNKFLFGDQEYEVNVKDAVIRRFESARLHPVGVSNGQALPIPGQHSMEIRLILGTLTLDSKLMYKKKGSNEAPKELNLVSTTVPDHRFVIGINIVINFDVNERKVLGYNKLSTTITAYDTTSNCNEQTPGFCQALHKHLDSQLSYGKIAHELGMQVKKQLTPRQY